MQVVWDKLLNNVVESDMYLKDKLFKKKGETWKKGEGILKRGGVYAISWREFTTW